MVEQKKVLIIDDQDEFRYVLKYQLESKGLCVLEADDGEKGIDIARKELPQLILLDGKMPGMGGAEVFQTLKSDPATEKIPVIIISGKSREDKEWQDLKEMAAGVIEKPCRLEELNEKISQIIGDLG